MSYAEQIKSLFPEDWPNVLENCADNPEIEEICSDLARLAKDLETAEDNIAFMSSNLKQDVLKTMDALAQEIRQKLDLS